MSISTTPTTDVDALKRDWLARLDALITDVKTWAEELDWSTRRIEKRLEDSKLGVYRAPALLLQKETVRGLLDPVSHSAHDVDGMLDGLVDFYLLPAYDDIAYLLFSHGEWRMKYTLPRPEGGPSPAEEELRPLTRATFGETLSAMKRYAETWS